MLINETPSSRGVTYSADILYLEEALQLSSTIFSDLLSEMRAFVPLERNQYENKMNAEIERLNLLNDPEKHDFIAKRVKQDFDFVYSDAMQFSDKFQSRYMAIMSLIALTSHALCEGAINANLAISSQQCDKVELFDSLENRSLLEKWTIIPLAFNDCYKLSKSGIVYGTLRDLCSIRNWLTHQKLHLRNNSGETIHKGNRIPQFTMSANDQARILRFIELPYALQSHFIDQQEDHFLSFILGNILKKRNLTNSNPVKILKSAGLISKRPIQ